MTLALVLSACQRFSIPQPLPTIPTIIGVTATREPAVTVPAPTIKSVEPSLTQAAELVITDAPTQGYDCSQVQSLPPDSPEAQNLVEALVIDFKEKWPTEYIGVEQLWAVDRAGEYAALQVMVTQEYADIFILKDSPQGYEIVSNLGARSIPSRYTIPEYFVDQLPGAPAELFYCMDTSHFAGDIPPQELDLNRAYDCSLIERVAVGSQEGKEISQWLEAYWASGKPVTGQLDQVRSIDRLGHYILVQARFSFAGQLGPPEIFLIEESRQGYWVAAYWGRPIFERDSILRGLYAQAPATPPELLACQDLAEWFLSTPTPASTMPT